LLTDSPRGVTNAVTRHMSFAQITCMYFKLQGWTKNQRRNLLTLVDMKNGY